MSADRCTDTGDNGCSFNKVVEGLGSVALGCTAAVPLMSCALSRTAASMSSMVPWAKNSVSVKNGRPSLCA